MESNRQEEASQMTDMLIVIIGAAALSAVPSIKIYNAPQLDLID
jgi:hypothetical protein